MSYNGYRSYGIGTDESGYSQSQTFSLTRDRGASYWPLKLYVDDIAFRYLRAEASSPNLLNHYLHHLKLIGMDMAIFEPYEVTPERGIRLSCELVVYLLQRKAHCKNPCKCADTAKSVQLVRNWPGGSITQNEVLLLHFLLGKIAAVHGFLSKMEQSFSLDFGMGAEYCIQKMEKAGNEVYKEMLTEHQKLWN